MAPLAPTRDQILAFRRRVGLLDARLQWGTDSLRRAAWAGLQDSMPRAALLSIHARLSDVDSDALAEPKLAQVWGPRFSVFVVTEEDAALFTLGRMPDRGGMVERANDVVTRLADLLGDGRTTYRDAGHALGVNPNSLRYGTLTGRIRLEWDGARRPTIWLVPPPEIEPVKARRELARRYLHVLGPGSPDGFASWAGVRAPVARAVFDDLDLVSVETPHGDRWMLVDDTEALMGVPTAAAGARLLPSGDSYWLFWGEDRSLLVPEADRRDLLWTSRVWPGAVLVDGEIIGVWRRSKTKVTVEPWCRLSKTQREAVEAEAMSFPLPYEGDITVDWAS